MTDLVEIGEDHSIPDEKGHPCLNLPKYWLLNSFVGGFPDVVHDEVVQE